MIDNKFNQLDTYDLNISSDIKMPFLKVEVKGGTEAAPANDYWMGKYPVRQKEYLEIMNVNPSRFTGLDNPVEMVDRASAMLFCEKLTKREHENGNLPKEYIYSLPMENEFEFAAKGGLKSRNYDYAGSNNPDEVAWYGINSGKHTHPVGMLKPNELGFYDMSGNVYVWCLDLFEEDSDSQEVEPDQEKPKYVCRGGCWGSVLEFLVLSYRKGLEADSTYGSLGFRVALRLAD